MIGILTKQLLVFPLFGFCIIYVRLTLINKDYLRLVVAIVSATILLVVFEAFIGFNNGYSHLEKIVLEGSKHGERIAANGFNLWVFLTNNHRTSSLVPFWNDVTPYQVGFIGFCLAVIGSIYNYLRRKLSIYYSLWLICMVNLSFNVFLTGTHERYLYYFYPFLLLMAFLNKNRIFLGITIVGGVIYGLFVYLGIKRIVATFL